MPKKTSPKIIRTPTIFTTIELNKFKLYELKDYSKKNKIKYSGKRKAVLIEDIIKAYNEKNNVVEEKAEEKEPEKVKINPASLIQVNIPKKQFDDKKSGKKKKEQPKKVQFDRKTLKKKNVPELKKIAKSLNKGDKYKKLRKANVINFILGEPLVDLKKNKKKKKPDPVLNAEFLENPENVNEKKLKKFKMVELRAFIQNVIKKDIKKKKKKQLIDDILEYSKTGLKGSYESNEEEKEKEVSAQGENKKPAKSNKTTFVATAEEIKEHEELMLLLDFEDDEDIDNEDDDDIIIPDDNVVEEEKEEEVLLFENDIKNADFAPLLDQIIIN